MKAYTVTPSGDIEEITVYRTNHEKVYKTNPSSVSMQFLNGAFQFSTEIHTCDCKVYLLGDTVFLERGEAVQKSIEVKTALARKLEEEALALKKEAGPKFQKGETAWWVKNSYLIHRVEITEAPQHKQDAYIVRTPSLGAFLAKEKDLLPLESVPLPVQGEPCHSEE